MTAGDGAPRIEDMLDAAYLEGLPSLDIGALRGKLSACREEEEVLSFMRRQLHVGLDILQAELDRRRTGGQTADEDTVARLRTILGGGPGGSRGARTRLPSAEVHAKAEQRLATIAPGQYLARLPDLEPTEIEEVLERLRAAEQRISKDRGRLHAVLEELESELARRYREGGVTPDHLLGGG